MSRCFRCGAKTNVPFADRKPCACGSVSWYQGQRPEWPPMDAPAFLAGAMPGGETLEILDDSARRTMAIERKSGHSTSHVRPIRPSDWKFLTSPGSVQKN